MYSQQVDEQPATTHATPLTDQNEQYCTVTLPVSLATQRIRRMQHGDTEVLRQLVCHMSELRQDNVRIHCTSTLGLIFHMITCSIILFMCYLYSDIEST